MPSTGIIQNLQIKLSDITEQLTKVRAERNKYKHVYNRKKQRQLSSSLLSSTVNTDSTDSNSVNDANYSRSKTLKNGKKKVLLYHPHLELVIGDIMYSPYLTSPLNPNYPSTIYTMADTLRSMKEKGVTFNSLGKGNAPYDVDEMKRKFIDEVINYIPSYSGATYKDSYKYTTDNSSMGNNDTVSLSSQYSIGSSSIKSISSRSSNKICAINRPKPRRLPKLTNQPQCDAVADGDVTTANDADADCNCDLGGSTSSLFADGYADEVIYERIESASGRSRHGNGTMGSKESLGLCFEDFDYPGNDDRNNTYRYYSFESAEDDEYLDVWQKEYDSLTLQSQSQQQLMQQTLSISLSDSSQDKDVDGAASMTINLDDERIVADDVYDNENCLNDRANVTIDSMVDEIAPITCGSMDAHEVEAFIDKIIQLTVATIANAVVSNRDRDNRIMYG